MYHLQKFEEDAKQEIRLAFLENPSDSLKQAQKNCYRLLVLYGFSRKLGWNGGLRKNIEYEDVLGDHRDMILDIVEYYKTHTAKETCAQFGFDYNKKIQKLLYNCHKKHLGYGGNRKEKNIA